MLSTVISLLSLGSDIFGAVSSIKQGQQIDEIIATLKEVNYGIQQISKRIFYVPDLQVTFDITRSTQQVINDPNLVRKALEPVQDILGNSILSSSIIATPDLMHKALRDDPWEALIDIRPVDRVKPPKDPDMVAFSFQHGNVSYIGWQKEKILPQIFNFNYNQRFWLPKSSYNQERSYPEARDFSFIEIEKTYFRNADLEKIWDDQFSHAARKQKAWETYYRNATLIADGFVQSIEPNSIVIKVSLRSGNYFIIAEFSDPIDPKNYIRIEKGNSVRITGSIAAIKRSLWLGNKEIYLSNSKLIPSK